MQSGFYFILFLKFIYLFILEGWVSQSGICQRLPTIWITIQYNMNTTHRKKNPLTERKKQHRGEKKINNNNYT